MAIVTGISGGARLITGRKAGFFQRGEFVAQTILSAY